MNINDIGLQDAPDGPETDTGVRTNLDGFPHPIMSSNGIISTINAARMRANAKENALSGEVQDQVFSDILQAVAQTKVPPDMIAFCMDWDSDITSGGGSAMGAANKLLNNINELRSTLGRDPNQGEVFASYVLGSAGEVLNRKKLSDEKPDEQAQGIQNEKVAKKLQNGKPVPRTNREVYTFFFRRINSGNTTVTKMLGNAPSNSTGSSLLKTIYNAIAPATPTVDSTNIGNIGIRG
jgi:hypothetical protein